MGVLADIVARKQARILALRESGPPARARHRSVDVLERLRRAPSEPLRLVGEIKRRSPSAGALSSALSPPDRADVYARAGVAAVSVLTDEDFFGGSFADLAEVAERVDVPLLCKDFILDPVQIDAAAAAGASMVLLIVRLLDPRTLGELARFARQRGLEPFVEVTTEDELEVALAAGARIVGVNARDLDTLAMDPARATRVIEAIPADRIAVHLSGLRSPGDVAGVSGRADGALIGEALMRQDDPGSLLAGLLVAAGGPWRPR